MNMNERMCYATVLSIGIVVLFAGFLQSSSTLTALGAITITLVMWLDKKLEGTKCRSGQSKRTIIPIRKGLPEDESPRGRRI